MQIILHIGQPKTASTTIQLYCDRNRTHLAGQGVLYPSSLGAKKAFIATFLNRRGRRAQMFGAPEEVLNNVRAEFSGSYDKAILSDETIYRCSKKNKESIKNIFEEHASSWRVLFYVRRPDEHIVSSYQQAIRNNTGFNGTFDEFYAQRLSDDYYRYNHQAELWADIFGHDAVEVRVFHRKTLQGGPVEDFLRWIGLDPTTMPPDIQEAANESVDRVGTEILRFLNGGEAQDLALLRGYDLDHIREQLRSHDSDDRLRLDTERATRLQDHFRKDHEDLAARYLTPEHAAILLAPPSERPAQPSIAPGLVLERLQAVFDPDFARRASAEIETRMRDETFAHLAAAEVEKRLQSNDFVRHVADELEKRVRGDDFISLVADELEKRQRDAAAARITRLKAIFAKVLPLQRPR